MAHDEYDFDPDPDDAYEPRAKSKSDGAQPMRAKEPEELQPPVEVPLQALSADALKGVIEAFILREGTDYGTEEVAHDTKIKQVRRQLEKGDIKIVFDPNTESVTLMTEHAWRKSQARSQ